MFETVSLAVAVALPGRDAVLLRVCTTGGVPDRLDAGGRSFGPLPGASTGCAGFLLPERLLQGRLRLSTGGRRCSVPAPVLVSPAAARILESSWRREQSARTALAEQAEHVVRLERRVLRERRRPGTGARGPERRRRGLQATALAEQLAVPVAQPRRHPVPRGGGSRVPVQQQDRRAAAGRVVPHAQRHVSQVDHLGGEPVEHSDQPAFTSAAGSRRVSTCTPSRMRPPLRCVRCSRVSTQRVSCTSLASPIAL